MQDASELIAIIERADNEILSALIATEYRPFRLIEVANQLVEISQGRTLSEKLAELDEEESEIKGALDQIRKNYEGVEHAFDGNPWRFQIAIIRHFLWPHFLIIAFGLKLARVHYWVSNRIDN